MIRTTLPLLLICLTSFSVQSQKDIRNFIFGHSLINHAIPINAVSSQETSVPHWFASLASAAGNQYAVDGQYGFLPQHANLPPAAQWGFDRAEGAWDSDNEGFSKANFNTILITPGNFIQWQSPNEDYPTDPVSPIEATNSIFEWCIAQEPDLKFYVYENWPDMAPNLANNFPPSESEWVEYNNYLNGDFHDWFIDYYSQVGQNFQNNCVSYIPVGTLISSLLQIAPYNEIPIAELYEDDAPHGRPTIYFLASLITYMTMYEEEAPLNYEVEQIIHPLIKNNYREVVDFLWTELVKLNDTGSVTVFCEDSILSNTSLSTKSISLKISPNPTTGAVKIITDNGDYTIDIFTFQGKHLSSTPFNSDSSEIDLSNLQLGAYLLVAKNKSGNLLARKTIVKI